MKRRNFVSGLLAAPLALKARFLALFRKRPVELCVAPMRYVEPCGAAIFGSFMPKASYDYRHSGGPLSPQMRRVVQLLTEKKPRTVDLNPVHCSLPRGHEGPHMLLNPIMAPQELSPAAPRDFCPEEVEAMRRKVAEISPGLIAALPRIRVNQISQMSSGRGLTVLTVDEGVALFPGEGSQPACGYQPDSPTVAPCALPRNHKLPHICRSKAKAAQEHKKNQQH